MAVFSAFVNASQFAFGFVLGPGCAVIQALSRSLQLSFPQPSGGAPVGGFTPISASTALAVRDVPSVPVRTFPQATTAHITVKAAVDVRIVAPLRSRSLGARWVERTTGARAVPPGATRQ